MGELMRHNYLYSLLTRGSKSFRHTEMHASSNDEDINEYIELLVPSVLSEKQKAFMAEFYLKLLYSDIDAIALLQKVDPYNSYTTVSYNIVLNDSEKIDIEEIYHNVKRNSPQFNTHGMTIVDCFVNVLKDILTKLNK
jgi:hypothetical protein